MIEVEIKNESCKKTEVTLANIEIVKDFRVLGAIGEGDENNIRKIDLKKYEKSPVGATDISQDIQGAKFCTFFKLDQSEILKQILF